MHLIHLIWVNSKYITWCKVGNDTVSHPLSPSSVTATDTADHLPQPPPFVGCWPPSTIISHHHHLLPSTINHHPYHHCHHQSLLSTSSIDHYYQPLLPTTTTGTINYHYWPSLPPPTTMITNHKPQPLSTTTNSHWPSSIFANRHCHLLLLHATTLSITTKYIKLYLFYQIKK